MTANLDILIRAQNQASSALNAVRGDLNALERAAGTAGRGFGGLQTIMGSGLKVAAGAAAAGVLALGAGFGAATVDGFRINSTLENVRAQLVAFTKDGDKADQMLADIREEAARTPFAFEELAKATASLLPASIQSGIALEDLIKQAEILAASNPAQGLEGAAFSLREALSGDFVSIIDRFNLPRTRLNELKEQGVPAMEAITIAMREMGLDASLVAGMALTMTGRWSTFKDTMDTVKAALAKPLFDRVKEGLSKLQPVLDANMPRTLEIATTIGEKMAGAVDALVSRGLPAMVSGFGSLAGSASRLLGFLRPVGAQIMALLEPVLKAVGSFVSWKDVLGAVGIVLASIVIPALVGIVTAAAPVILVAAALVAGVALLRNAWERDWGGIQGKTAAAVAAVGGWIDGLRGWLTERLPGWIESARGAFDTLLGWIEAAKKGDFAPLLTGLGSAFNAALTGISTAIQSFAWADWIDGVLAWGSYVGALVWSGFVSALDWAGGWITSLDWGGFVATLADWGTWIGAVAWDAFISALTWGADIIKSVDWGAFIANLSAWSDYVQALAWDAFVSALTWGAEYITSLDWASFVSTLSDWGTWITSLDWTKIITTAIDWAMWIPAMAWNNFVKLLDWATIVAAFAWTEWISKLKWSDIVAAFDSWGDAVGTVDWSERIAKFTDWASYIAEFAWSSFVEKLDWPLIADFDWGEWIASFRWPSLPSFSWSSWIASFSWPTLPTVNWSNFIPHFSWPSIPSFPGWSAFVGFLGGGGSKASDAAGTNFFRGGLTMVGERGPELVALPRGSQISTAEQTARAGQGNINVTINANVADGMDLESLAYRIASMIQQKQRGGAYGAA